MPERVLSKGESVNFSYDSDIKAVRVTHLSVPLDFSASLLDIHFNNQQEPI